MNSVIAGVVIVAAALLMRQVNGECAWTVERQAIMCFMRTLDNSSAIEFADGNANVADTRTISIRCDNTLLDESVLGAGFFRSLSHLESITIEGCKLLQLANGTFDGARNLRRIDIETKNNDWGAGNKLEIDATIFERLSQIEEIKLTENNLRRIPHEVLCPLKNLKMLNVSANRIGGIDGFGVPHECSNRNQFNELTVLDISHNQLLTFEANWGEASFPNLRELHLQHNNLTAIGAGAFRALHVLTHLNLSYNQLETLANDMLNETKQLQELHLQNNRLYQLPVDIFAHLAELMVLDLSGNQLSSHYIDSSIFAGLKRLVILNLANNALTRIESHTFHALNFLQILDMRNNSIGFIDEQALRPLNNLHTLNLSGNRLHIIGRDLFNGMFVLSRLVLTNNLITMIDPRAFRNCTALKELDLSSNQLSDVPAAVRDLTMLKSLDLGENRIIGLRNDSFLNMSQLTGLRLMDNLIVNITNGILYPLQRLQVLNLARNKIQNIERGSFDKNTVIEAIRLDKNLLTDINGIFATLNSLLWLNLSENQLAWFDYAFIPMNLKWLDIHSNYIEALGNYYRLQSEITVTTLDASHNRISEIGSQAVPNSIELFFVNNNIVRNVYPNTFIDKKNLTRVDLYSNAISKLHMHSLRISAIALSKRRPEFYLGGNPFECDCSMGWFRNINEMSVHRQQQHPHVMDYENIECLVTHKRNAPVRLLASLGAHEFLCRYESQCPASCHCCELQQCHCNVKCPANCVCFHDQSGAINKINCGKQNALLIPDKVPVDATDLYLDGNNFFELQANAFNTIRHLRTLYLNNSNVIQIQPHAFNGLGANLQRLHLEDNKLTALYGTEFNQLYHIKELYLHNNLLAYIENATFHSMKFLQVLRLDGNRLTSLSTWQMHSLRNLKSLTLSRNLWSCGCNYVQEFIGFIYDSNVIVTDSNALYCVEDGAAIDTANGNDDALSAARKRLIDRNLTNECKGVLAGTADSNVVVLSPEGIPHGYIPLMAFAFVIIFILAVLVAVFTIKEQMCCMGGSAMMLGTGADKNDGSPFGTASKPMYDALILAAHEDCDYVLLHIVNELKQNKSQIRIGLQHKNVSAAKLLTATYSSRKLIIYVTNSFLQTEWTRPEIRSAVANSWFPGKVILIQAPNLNMQTNNDRELFNNAGRGVVLLRSWEVDFAFKLAYAIETHPSHYTTPTHSHQKQPIIVTALPPPPTIQHYNDAAATIWKSTTSKQLLMPYHLHYNDAMHPGGSEANDNNDSYYSTATATSILSRNSSTLSRQMHEKQTINEHVYIGIDSDYGSATNDDPSTVSNGVQSAQSRSAGPVATSSRTMVQNVAGAIHQIWNENPT